MFAATPAVTIRIVLITTIRPSVIVVAVIVARRVFSVFIVIVPILVAILVFLFILIFLFFPGVRIISFGFTSVVLIEVLPGLLAVHTASMFAGRAKLLDVRGDHV